MDYFEHPNLLPKAVQEIIKKHKTMEVSYATCESIISELKKLGWTCDYGPFAELHDLKPLTTEVDSTSFKEWKKDKDVVVYKSHYLKNDYISVTYANILKKEGGIITTVSTETTVEIPKIGGALESLYNHIVL